MSYLGYGDFVPRTKLGRFYAVMWILMSILLFSWLTAIITTATSAETIGRKDVKGMKIGVYAGTPAYELAYSLGAQCIILDNLPNIRRQLPAADVDGYVLDNFRVLFLSDTLDSLDLEVQWFYEYPIIHGIKAQNIDPDLANCMQRNAYGMHYEILERLGHNTRPLKAPKGMSRKTIDDNFGCFSLTIQKGVYFQLCMSGFFVLCHYGSHWIAKFFKQYRERKTKSGKNTERRCTCKGTGNQPNPMNGNQQMRDRKMSSDNSSEEKWPASGYGLANPSFSLATNVPVRCSSTRYSFQKTSFTF